MWSRAVQGLRRHAGAASAAAVGAGAMYVAMNVGPSPLMANEVAPRDTTRGMLREVLSKLNRIESAVANPKRDGPGVDVVLGAQWGDEGKGKLVDMLSQEYDIIARVAGGANAGHTIVCNGKKYKFHLVPSGVLNDKAVCVIGNGVVVHLPSLLNELNTLKEAGVDCEGRVLISDRAHMVLDLHQEIDGLMENRRGRNKIGTTKKGIGPAYSSKMLRNGVRVGDLRYFDDFAEKMRAQFRFYKENYPDLDVDVEAEIERYRELKDTILPITIDSIEYLNKAYVSGKKILVEGANATMLDIDFGTYPYVTSSNPSIGSICTGGGISPNRINGIIGIVKAYCTRVGEGPFPTELHDDVGAHLGSVGAEFGTTTGRPRRCGWLDIPQMKYSNLVNGFTEINLTKLDVLTGLKEVKIGVAYWHNGKKLAGMPSNLQPLEESTVQYETLPGWSEDISKCRTFEDLPVNAQKYVLRVEELLGTHIKWIGVGQDRLDVIERPRPLPKASAFDCCNRRRRASMAPTHGRKRNPKPTSAVAAPVTDVTSENVSASVLAARDAEKCVEYLHGMLRAAGYWEPAPPLAGFLSLPLHQFELGHAESNAVWCTMLVLIHCMTALVDYHDYWRPLADKARAWLFGQRFFTAGTSQLVKRACALCNADPKAMLATVFAKAGDGTADSDTEPPMRGNWVPLVLETPPYTRYYWNQVTKETRWEHPLDPHEPTPDELLAASREAAAKKAKDERLARVLPQRLQINKARYLPPRPQECESCAKGVAAVVLCVACDEYECEACCDAIHMNAKKSHHCRESFRFVSCYGRQGFPYLRPSLKALQHRDGCGS
ncbi:adenylosuccinate synthetase [Achlya hypogyna]|uniref:Adenylosuccinate synthetase n=1 Tax=Achlya hypogyna TaxID=1202772 RepID=A0A1V9Y9Z1_ACHHY|nr:adenylosuccinate synthetase [Achlya hypogyna]